LLAIRSRSQFANTLEPMESGQQMFWEYLNYVLMLTGLAAIYIIYRSRLGRQHKRHARLLQTGRSA
jgi:ABC-2 type transport system permease protein